MRLRVLLPGRTVVDEAVDKVTAEAADGAFCLLPRHADFVTALVAGLLAHRTQAVRAPAGLPPAAAAAITGELLDIVAGFEALREDGGGGPH